MRSLFIALPCSLLAVALTLSAAPPDTDSLKAKRLLLERREVLKELSDLTFQLYQHGQGNVASAILAQKDLLEADLELAEQRSQRIEIYERFVKTMETLEDVIQQQYKAGETGKADVLSSKAARLKAQADLINERAKPAT